MKRPTQADVARLAGVSRATVSYVINGRADRSVSITEETRQRVLWAIEQLGYQPHAAAQSLRSGMTKIIGLLIPDMHNPHYWQIVRGVEDAARAEGYDLLLASTSLDPKREQHSVRALLRRRIDGLILLLTFGDRLASEIEMLARRHGPVVLLGGQVPGLDVVEPGYESGAAQMMRYLLSLGHRRIAFIHGVACPTLGGERLTVYRRVLQERGWLNERWVIHCGSTLEDGYQAASHLLDCSPRPTAILVVNDLLAIGALRAVADRGLRVPEDISIAGFDDIEVAAYLTPPLTTVRVDSETLGRESVRLVLARMRDPERPLQHIRVSAQLIVRASTGSAPAD
ncbi:MAG: LacI family DNA-binding transcriptional regulator [Anaerolineae bacterium]|nr:LacI family DNA-binding transcriptional regulator [Anaerolineae bacterium]